MPTISTYAGGGLPTAGPATATGIGESGGIARDGAGNLYFSSSTGAILKLDTSGNISVLAGNGTGVFSGDGGPAASAQTGIGISTPPAPVKTDAAGNIYFADGISCTVRRIDASTGDISTVAGTPNTDFYFFSNCNGTGDGGPATSAQLSAPSGLAFDAAGDLFIADYGTCVVRRVDHSTGIITTVAGVAGSCGATGGQGDGGAATSAILENPIGILLDGSGNLYIADSDPISFSSHVRMVNATTHVITTIAGGGTSNPNGVLTATNVLLRFTTGLAFDPSGNLLIVDNGIPGIVSVNKTTQVVTLIAGQFGVSGFSGDGGQATAASFANALGQGTDPDLAVDPATGTIYVTDGFNFRVRKIDGTTHIITTIAGNGGVGDAGPATSAALFDVGLAVDTAGDLFIADTINGRVRMVDHSTQNISTVAGMDVGPVPPPSGDNGPATSAQLFFPRGAAVDSSGDLYFGDNNYTVRRVDGSSKVITRYAGTGNPGFSGDNGPATSAKLRGIRSLATDPAGNLYIADPGNNVIRFVAVGTGTITTVAGNTSLITGGKPSPGYSGDGGPATLAQLNNPSGISLDASGNLLISDQGNDVIREVYCATGSPTCTPPAGFAAHSINTVAGNFNAGGGMGGDGGPATAAALFAPSSVAADVYDNIYISDGGNLRVRVVNSVTGIITTLAGNGLPNFGGDGGPATAAGIWPFHGLATAIDGSGNILVYTQDEFSGRVRLITIPPVPVSYLSPGAGLAFTSQQTGTTSAAQFITVTNSGTGPLNASNVLFSGANPGDFAFAAGGTCTSATFVLAPTASCTLGITFSPQGTGLRTASVSLMDNETGTPASVMLVGNGSAGAPPGAPSGLTATPGTHVVNLSWTASPTGGVTYNVYRMLQSGGVCAPASSATYSLIASSIGTTAYPDMDSSLMAGSTYCYAVTAVSGGLESTFSNVATAALGAGFVPTLTITMATLPNGAVGVPYGADISFNGGHGPYFVGVTSGALPAGFSMTTTGGGNVNPGHVYNTTSPPTTAGTFTFGVTVTDSSSPTPQMTTMTISLTIGAAPANTQPSLLKGQYAFSLTGFNDGNDQENGALGSLNFDGAGNITGVVDVNDSQGGISQNVAVTGTYSVGPDNRGFMTLSAAGMPGNLNLAIAVGTVYRGVAYEARITQFNDSNQNDNIGSGFMRLQDPTAFNQNAVAATYMFGATGQDPGLGRVAESGLISFDNLLHITGGSSDYNDNGTEGALTSITGTYTAPDANGRMVFTETLVPGGPSTVVTYIIDSSEAVFMNLDPRTTNAIMIGSALRQASPGTFSNGSLHGPDVLYFNALESGGGGSEAISGVASASGSTLTANYDDNSAGSLTLGGTIAFNYSVAANGRVAASSANAGLICYLASQDHGFCILPGDSSAGAGQILPQSGGPFSASTIGSNVYFGQSETVQSHESISGIGVPGGSGTLNLTVDDSHQGGDLSFGQSAQFNFTVTSNGHVTGIPNAQIGGTSGYLVSPYELTFLDTTNGSGQGQGQMNSGHPHVYLAKTIVAPPGTPGPTGLAVNFPTTVQQGMSAQSAPITLTNNGLGPMIFTGVDNSAAMDFSASGTVVAGSGVSSCLPVAGMYVLQPGVSCTIVVSFNPTAATPTGTMLNETLVITTDGTGSLSISVSGMASPSGGGCGTNMWVGMAGDGQWGTAGNWSGGVPVAGNDVCIPTGFDVTVGGLAAGNQTINSLTVQGTSTLTITGGPLTVTTTATATTLTVNGGTLTVSGAAT
ncbi:MAG TPA: choice-of-anchor D domain-containing protein, partial [Patescibacteria group bacterium]|nr:choice-of-anchor D domain-containing protein [Patescibacteria group bacterium]